MWGPSVSDLERGRGDKGKTHGVGPDGARESCAVLERDEGRVEEECEELSAGRVERDVDNVRATTVGGSICHLPRGNGRARKTDPSLSEQRLVTNSRMMSGVRPRSRRKAFSTAFAPKWSSERRWLSARMRLRKLS